MIKIMVFKRNKVICIHWFFHWMEWVFGCFDFSELAQKAWFWKQDWWTLEGWFLNSYVILFVLCTLESHCVICRVLLPTKQCVEGTLQHYNLHYNIALVSVKGFRASHPAKIQHLWNDHSCDVVAVGYCFKSGKLMAARGRQFGRPATLDCKYLRYSTCKITNVGCYFSYILLFRVYTSGP